MLLGLNIGASIFCCEVWDALFPPGPRGVKGAALAACVEKVDFLFDCKVDGVNDGDSTLRVFLPDLNTKHMIRKAKNTRLKRKTKKNSYPRSRGLRRELEEILLWAIHRYP